ncbi:MAG: tetratricopeptide repeat protein [Bryobacteraceae bacterium]|nr:tetratricopeptide repeat protein [Bryobacteraceae bacterium]
MRLRVFLLFIALFIAASACVAQGTQATSSSDLKRTFAAAEALMKAGKVPDAAQVFERIVHLRPDFGEAHFALGVAYIQLGKPAEAVAALRSYLKFEPGSADGHAILGIALFNDGRISDARPELERAVRLDRSQVEAAKTLGRVYNLEGDAAKAIALLRPIVASRAADDETRTVFASALLRSGEAASATRLLDETLTANPHSPIQTYILAAMAARDTHNLPKAFEICERGTKVYPNSEQLESLAVSFPEEALIARTTQHIEQIRNNLKDATEMIAVGRIIIAADKGKRSGTLELGATLLTRATQLEPDNAAAWYHYGRCLLAQAKPEEAAAAFNKALAVVHDDELQSLILGRIGFTETRFNHFDAAEEAFRKSLELNRKLDHHIPESAMLYYKFLVLRERDSEWHALLDEILRWEPLYAPAMLERAKDYLSREQPEKALEAALLVTRNTEDPETLRAAHFFLVKIYRMLGRNAEAQVHADWIQAQR